MKLNRKNRRSLVKSIRKVRDKETASGFGQKKKDLPFDGRVKKET